MPPLSSAAWSADRKTVQSSGDTACGPRPAAWFRRLSAEVLRNRLSSSSTQCEDAFRPLEGPSDARRADRSGGPHPDADVRVHRAEVTFVQHGELRNVACV